MAFVIAVSLFFAILDISLLKFLIFLNGLRKVLSPRIEHWIQGGVLQLQRRAYEAIGEGTWSNLDQEVPLTEPKELLKTLPLQHLPSKPSTVPFISPSSPPTSSMQSQSCLHPPSPPCSASASTVTSAPSPSSTPLPPLPSHPPSNPSSRLVSRPNTTPPLPSHSQSNAIGTPPSPPSHTQSIQPPAVQSTPANTTPHP
jgi:hypothetical protein